MRKKIICAVLLSLIYFSPSYAYDSIRMIGKEEYGYSIPRYVKHLYDWPDLFQIELIGPENNFPWSSVEQGSIFSKIFEDIANKEHIAINIKIPYGGYKLYEQKFEKQIETGTTVVDGIIATYYENIPYSKNEYLYPAIFENEIYLITTTDKNLLVSQKEDLRKYQGVYIEEDYISKFVKKNMEDLGIRGISNFPEGYKELLTGKVDFIVASYHKSQIELYKLGIRDYVAYSKNPVWKMPMFIRIKSSVAQQERVNNLKKYLKSERYKTIRDKAFQELIEIYRENTKGIVPPTYINQNKETNNTLESKE